MKEDVGAEKHRQTQLNEVKNEIEKTLDGERKRNDNEQKSLKDLTNSLKLESNNSHMMTQQLSEGITFLEESKKQLSDAKEVDLHQKEAIADLRKKIQDEEQQNKKLISEV